MCVLTKTCTEMFMTVLFIIVKNKGGNLNAYQLVKEWTNYEYLWKTVKFYSPIQRNKPLISFNQVEPQKHYENEKYQLQKKKKKKALHDSLILNVKTFKEI